MVLENRDEIDLQQLTENVSFLAECFDNSFAIQSSLSYVKDCVQSQPKRLTQKQKFLQSKRENILSQTIIEKQNSSCKVELLSQLKVENRTYYKNLKNWGLPYEIASKYENKGIVEMFDWQVDCLGNSKVLLECRNLVYSAPTSAGKTLVAEILAIKTVLERQKKVIIILPFISIVREKMFYLQDILSSSGVRVEGFMGSQSPPGGLKAVHIAICTIEKANSLVNKLLDEGNITELGAVIVDELHLLGDPHRGYILELLLTKVKYISSKLDNMKIQIIGMSATLPNLEVLADWLEAELFITEFRPIPLNEFCLVGNKYYDKNGQYTRSFNKPINMGIECDYVLSLCLETLKEGCSILIFCMTKNRCENLAQTISASFYKLGCTDNEQGTILREQLKPKNILEVLEQLKNCPVGLDQILKNIISFGVAYHHAGLTFDERDIIEGAFKSGAIRVLVATSTLSSGVNLPARKVIIRSPVFQKQPINILTYKQMIGRAGRMGKDTQGESVLICTAAEQKIGFELMMGTLDPVQSCINSKDKFMRAILEIIASQDVFNQSELDLYTKCTLLCAQQSMSTSQNDLLEDTLKELINFELVRIQTEGDDKRYVATSLGKACLSSSMAPNDGLSLFCEIQKARQCLVLETDLHLIYLVTPYSVSNQWNDIDWLHLLTLWESLTAAMKRVGELVGVQESFIIRCLRNTNKSNTSQNKLSIHKRFYTALALQDLVNEVPLSEVASKFQCARGFLQGLQQSSATFAGMVTSFCHQLGWKNMETLVSQFQDRLQFGIHSELLELMKLTSLNGIRARTLFDAGFETISSIASADVNIIENTLYKSMPFQSEKEREGDDDLDVRKRNKIKNIWITGCCGVTAREAAENLILEARKYLTIEIGVSEIKWSDLGSSENSLSTDIHENKMHGTQINMKNQNIEFQNNMRQISGQENRNNELSCKNDPSVNFEVENKVGKNIVPLNTSKNDKQDLPTDRIESAGKSSSSSKVKKDDCHKASEKDNITNMYVPIKEDLMWESLNITGNVLENITKLRTSDIIFSPNITFSESMDSPKPTEADINNLNSTSKSITAKDISLFSSEGDSSSIFEESFGLIADTLVKNNLFKIDAPNKNLQTSTDFMEINSKSILNAFKSPILKVDEDEDIKLVYDDEKCDNKEMNENLNKSQENEIINTQDFKEPKLKNGFISPLKRCSYLYKDSSQSLAKKSKLSKPNTQTDSGVQFKLKSFMSKDFALKFAKNTLNCYVLRENDVNTNFLCIENATGVSIILDTSRTVNKSSNIIRNNIIFKKPIISSEQQIDRMEELPIKGIALCLKHNLCVYLDLTSLGNFLPAVKLKIARLFSNAAFKMKMLCTKSNYVHIKKWLGKDLVSECTDLTLAEWLLDSDERISKIIDLTKKYCDIDLTNSQITVDDKKKKYNDLDTYEVACLKAWCIWAVAEKQSTVLVTKYQVLEEALHTDTQIAKILGNCEFYGVHVDKNLASQLLIDVKNSQEALQKKAFKLCGYHYNFNSSKDVAKALGVYRGRKVSTRKSVLCAHNSALASIVIYWRKLHSILTKTLYPLTERAFNYSADDRISPSYTMFTCTGRISMHEPNLQNVPRTFTIPLRYLKVIDDNESCEDVIEYNCRNIFKASSGYVFVSADYCQLEMRILTHYCKDAGLTRIMKSNVDVFKSIAASWSGVPEQQVDEDLRQKAKQLCYGILYGMGNRTLAQHLDVDEIEAAMFMDTFYKTYPAIKVFTQGVIDECRKNGYVETLMRRRRYLPDISSNVVSKRSTAERQAVNTTIQGSAADIAKAAMCAIHTYTSADVDEPRLILQMHDELIYEVIESKKNTFIHTIKKLMEDTVHLNAPLPVKVKTGYTWGSMEEVKL